MKLIELSKTGKNKGKYFVQVDDADYAWLNQFNWSVAKSTNTFYGERTAYENGVKKKIMMHRFILGLTNPKIECDHIDNNGLNNQRYNLRIATHSQNLMNQPKKRCVNSTYKGVSYDKSMCRKKRWSVRIMVNRTAIRIGRYLLELDAAIAYDEAAKKYHGEFANLNFP